MKIKYLGTGAAEGIPAIFCQCETCMEARRKKGNYIRTRSQAFIDGKLLIEFNPDTYLHILKYDIDISQVEHCLVTHAHADHIYADDLEMRNPLFAHNNGPKVLKLYGSQAVKEKVSSVTEKDGEACGFCEFVLVKPYEPFYAGDYKVTALPARHAPETGPYIYVIEKDGKALLYGHDTGYYFEEVWQWFEKEKIHLDLVSLDCTEAEKVIDYDSHCNIQRDISIKNRMIEEKIADENTVFVLNHFSHNGENVGYDAFLKTCNKYGFTLSYDGVEIEV